MTPPRRPRGQSMLGGAASVAMALVAACSTPEPSECVPSTTPWVAPSYADSPPAPASNPLTVEAVALGEALFFDPRLSGSGETSCASCHDPALAFTDGRARSFADDGSLTRRSAPSLIDVGHATALTWANPLLRDLEDHALIPLFGEAPREMAAGELRSEPIARIADDLALAAGFRDAFPCDENPVTIARVADALAAYQRTLLSGRSRYDAYVAGDVTALSTSEQRGLALLTSERLACTRCHVDFGRGREAIGTGAFHNTGVYALADYAERDRGLYEHTRAPENIGEFAVPTLRNISLTAPYMHDGSIGTLAEVLTHYERGAHERSDDVPRFTLSEAERNDVLSFFDALTEPPLAR